ncbi:MAG: hypothetical protein ACREFM_18715, partial [Hypericibacter sp.]
TRTSRNSTSQNTRFNTSLKLKHMTSTNIQKIKWVIVLVMVVSTPSAFAPEPALPGLDYGSDGAHSSDWAGADKEPIAAHMRGQSGRRHAPSP